MKKFFQFLLLSLLSINTINAQVNQFDILGINCFNDTGYIALELQSPSIAYEWELQSFTDSLWYPIDTSQYLINLTSDTLITTICGRYRVSVFNASPFYFQQQIFIIPCPVSIGLGQDNIQCYGDSSAVLYAPTYGGVMFDPDSSFNLLDSLSGDEFYTYQWFTADSINGYNEILLNDTLPFISGISAGFYKSVVTDALGCTDTLHYFSLNNPVQLTFDSINSSNISCVGSSDGAIYFSSFGGKKITDSLKYIYYLTYNSDTVAFNDVNGSSSNLIINQSGATMQSLSSVSVEISNLFPGQYNLSVIDSFGCSVQIDVIIAEPSTYFAYSSTTTPLLCLSDSVWIKIDSVNGGNNNHNFYWLDSQDSLDSLYVRAGEYDIVIHDTIFGCFDTLSAIFEPVFEMNVSATIQDAFCFGDSTGSINIDSVYGGNAPYSIEWGGVDNNNLFAGTYIIEIIDSIGCQQFEYFQVGQNSQLNVNISIYNPSCFGLNNGSIAVEPYGATFPYNIQWQNGTGSVDSLYGLSDGDYYLQITDNYGCLINDTISVDQPSELEMSFTNYSNPLACYGQLTSIDAIVSGGTGPFNISWSNNSNTLQNILAAGFWSCDITDNNGCYISDDILITEPNLFFISDSSFVNPKCDVGGTASVSTIGGTSPIQYLWSSGETTASISGITTDVCWVIATDSCGNQDSVGFNLIPYELITNVDYIDSSHISSVSVSSLSTANNFTFEWIDDFGNIVSTDSTVVNLCPGTYIIKTTDVINGCEEFDTLYIDFNITEGIFDIETTTVFADSSLWGFPPYSFLWDNGDITQHSNICPGEHWVEVTDNDGCMIREDFIIDNISVLLDPSTIIECNLENLDVELTISPSGGTDPYTFIWSNGGTDSVTNLSLAPGPLSVQVMDNNACVLDTLFTITAMTAECVPNVFTPNNDQVNDTWDLEQAFIYADSEINVYSRFGKKIFSSVGYAVPWDGNNKNGKPVSDGAYFYHIELGHGFNPIKGAVTILR